MRKEIRLNGFRVPYNVKSLLLKELLSVPCMDRRVGNRDWQGGMRGPLQNHEGLGFPAFPP